MRAATLDAAFKKRLTSIGQELSDLLTQKTNSPTLSRSLAYLHRAHALLSGETPGFKEEYPFSRVRDRQYVARCIKILKTRRKGATIQQLREELQSQYPEMMDVQYRQIHPVIRGEVAHPKRRLAEVGVSNGRKLYGLPHWKSAQPYSPGEKYS